MQRLPYLSESRENPQEKNISEPLVLVKENWQNGRIKIRYFGQKSNQKSSNKEGGGKNHMRWLFNEVLSVMAKKKWKRFKYPSRRFGDLVN